MQNKICCFIGHRKLVVSSELCEKLKKTIVWLIEKKGVNWFLFGSASKFDELCLKTVTELQKSYPEIKRTYVRSNCPYIRNSHRKQLLKSYDDTLIPSKVKNAGRAAYVERNQEMIDASDFCVFYYNPDYKPPIRKPSKGALTSERPNSGTKLAYEYAVRKSKDGSKTVINIREDDFLII